MQKKKVLVIGGAGYLGSVLVRRLLTKGYKVRVLDSLFYGKQSIEELERSRDFELIVGDIRNLDAVIKAVNGCDSVIHLAAIVGAPACGLDENSTIEINYLSTRAIVDACKRSGVERLQFASTCSVYGANDGLVSENVPANPLELYARTKLDSEKVIRAANSKKLATTVMRMSTIFGLSNRMRFDLVVNLLTARASTEKRIPIFGGNQWRPFIHVADAADAYVRCLETDPSAVGGEIVNIGFDSMNMRIEDVGRIVAKCVPDALLTIEPGTDLRDYRVSFSKAKRLLSLSNPVTAEEGVLAIKKEFQNGRFRDWHEPKYSNFQKGIEDYYRSIILNNGSQIPASAN